MTTEQHNEARFCPPCILRFKELYIIGTLNEVAAMWKAKKGVTEETAYQVKR